MKYIYFLAMVLLLKPADVQSQAVPRGTEVQELVKIAEVYTNR